MKLDFWTVAIVVAVGALVIAGNSAIPPQPDPLPGSFLAEMREPLPLPIGMGLLALLVAVGAWLHSPRGLRSGAMGWLIAIAVIGIVILSAYQF